MKTIAQQKKQLRDLVGDGAASAVNMVLREIGKDQASLDRLLANGDELRAAVVETVTKKSRELWAPNQFATEEVDSACGYPHGYHVRSLSEQTNILYRLFPDRNFDYMDIAGYTLPKSAEGWFAIPRWQTLGATYQEALVSVLVKLSETRKDGLADFPEGLPEPGRFRQTERKAEMVEDLSHMQKRHSVLIMPAQFGLRHRGRSVRRAREVFLPNEFGLGAFELGVMALTHPTRFDGWEYLHTDCPGDEGYSAAVDQFKRAPTFRWTEGSLQFCTSWIDRVHKGYGSVTAFLPEA